MTRTTNTRNSAIPHAASRKATYGEVADWKICERHRGHFLLRVPLRRMLEAPITHKIGAVSPTALENASNTAVIRPGSRRRDDHLAGDDAPACPERADRLPGSVFGTPAAPSRRPS